MLIITKINLSQSEITDIHTLAAPTGGKKRAVGGRPMIYNVKK